MVNAGGTNNKQRNVNRRFAGSELKPVMAMADDETERRKWH
jgi:hypothetical protein